MTRIRTGLTNAVKPKQASYRYTTNVEAAHFYFLLSPLCFSLTARRENTIPARHFVVNCNTAEVLSCWIFANVFEKLKLRFCYIDQTKEKKITMPTWSQNCRDFFFTKDNHFWLNKMLCLINPASGNTLRTWNKEILSRSCLGFQCWGKLLQVNSSGRIWPGHCKILPPSKTK